MASLEESIAKRRLERQPPSVEEQEQRIQAVEDPSGSLANRIAQQRELRKKGVQTTSPEQSDLETRRKALAIQVGEENLGEPGLTDFGPRADISLSSTFGEKRAKFMADFPDGDFVSVRDPTGGTTVLFRKNQDEQFAELDADALEKFEFIGDLADLTGDVPSLAVEALLTRGSRLVTQALQIFAGNLVGEGLKEVSEELRGFQQETFTQVAERSLIQATLAAGATVPSVVISGPLNAFRGAGVLKITPGAKQAQRAAAELGIPRLLPSQVAQNPLVRRIGGQSAATVSTIGEYIRQQNAAATRTIMGLREPQIADMIKGEVRKLHNEAADQILTAAKIVDTDLTKGGTAIQTGIAEYDDFARAMVNREYTNARLIETPRFSAEALMDIATEVKVRAEKIGPDAKGAASLADQILKLDPSLPPETIQLPSGKTIEVPATDQLRFLRSQAYALKTPAPGDIPRAGNAEASKLFAILSRTLDNPVGGSPDFVNAWQKANGLARERFITMDKLAIVQAVKSETPAMLAARLAKPLQVDNLRTLRETVPSDKWQSFQQSVKADFVAPRNIDNLTKRLKSFDKETLDILVTPTDQADLRLVGRNWDRLRSLDLEGALERQTTRAGFIRELVESGQTKKIAALVEASGSRPALRKSLRAGIMEDVWNRVVRKTDDNELIVNRKALTKEISDLEQSGAGKFLTVEDKSLLKNLDRVAGFIPEKADSGTSLQAGQAAAGIRGLTIEAAATILENLGVGRFMTGKTVSRFLIGSGKEARPFASIRLLAATIGDVASDVESEEVQ